MHLYFPCSSVWLTVNFHPAGLAWVAAERFAYRIRRGAGVVTSGPRKDAFHGRFIMYFYRHFPAHRLKPARPEGSGGLWG